MATKGQTTESQVGLKINGEAAAKTIAQLQSDVRTLSRELRQLPVDTEEFNEKAKQLGEAQNRLQGIRDQAKEVRDQMKQMGDNAKNARADLLSMSPVGQMLQNFTANFTAVRGAIMANVQAMGLLRVAIAATGIGALVLAITSLIAMFTRSEEGGKKMEMILKAIGFAADTLTRVLIDVGQALFDAFENPKKALSDFADFLLNNIINRFKAFGVILDGIANLDMKKLTDGFVQVASGVENATDKITGFKNEIMAAVDEGVKLGRLIDEIDGAENRLIVTNAAAEKQISQLLLQARDRTKSESERLLILDRVSAIETNRLAEQIALADLKYKRAKINHDNTLRNKLDEQETEKALAEAEANRILLQKESIDLQEKIGIRRNALLDQMAEKEKAMREAEEKAQAEADKAELEYQRKLSDLRIANLQDEDERKRVQILANYQRGLEDAFANGKLTEELQKELLIQRDQALTALEVEIEARKTKEAEDRRDKRVKEESEAYDLETQQREAAIEAAVMAEETKEQRLYEVRRMGLDNKLALLATAGLSETNEAKKIALEIEKLETDHQKKRVELAKRTEQQKQALSMMALSQAGQLAGQYADMLMQDAATRRRYSELIKGLQIAEVTTSGIVEVQNIWKNANSNPINTLIPGWGPAFATFQTALAIARTGLSINQISSQKFERGGIITPKGGLLTEGQRHSTGGIHLIDGATGHHLGEVERGEHLTVFSRSAYQNNKPIIDALLDSSLYRGGAPVSGRKFAEGGMIDIETRSREGGETAAATNAVSMALLAEMKGLRQDFQQFPRVLHARVDFEQNNAVAMEAAAIEAGANA